MKSTSTLQATKAPLSPSKSVKKAYPGKPIIIYLKTGDLVQGNLLAFHAKALVIQLADNTLHSVPLLQYNGMVLDTPEEKPLGEALTRNVDAFIEAAQYGRQIRPKLDMALEAQLKTLPNVCIPTIYPIMHFRVNRQGTLLDQALITRSNCPHLNLAIANAARKVTFMPLTKKYPLDQYVFNYFYPIYRQTTKNPLQDTSKTIPAVKIKPAQPVMQTPKK